MYCSKIYDVVVVYLWLSDLVLIFRIVVVLRRVYADGLIFVVGYELLIGGVLV